MLSAWRSGGAVYVPDLIETFDQLGSVPEPGSLAGTIDTVYHVWNALQAITNQDAGRSARDWRAWYDANKSKTQEQWILDGFAKQHFPVASPPDDVQARYFSKCPPAPRAKACAWSECRLRCSRESSDERQ